MAWRQSWVGLLAARYDFLGERLSPNVVAIEIAGGNFLNDRSSFSAQFINSRVIPQTLLY